MAFVICRVLVVQGQALAVEVVVVVLVPGQLAPIFPDGCVESSNFVRCPSICFQEATDFTNY